MKKTFRLLNLTLMFLLLSCGGGKKQPIDITVLVNSKWIYSPFENCDSYYTFKNNGSGESYNCEMELANDIKYKVIENTLIVEEFDIPTEDNPEHKTFKSREDTYIFKDNSLILIKSLMFDMNGKTNKSKIEASIEYKREKY